MSHVLYQHGTLGTLMAGLLEGTASIDELLEPVSYTHLTLPTNREV